MNIHLTLMANINIHTSYIQKKKNYTHHFESFGKCANFKLNRNSNILTYDSLNKMEGIEFWLEDSVLGKYSYACVFIKGLQKLVYKAHMVCVCVCVCVFIHVYMCVYMCM